MSDDRYIADMTHRQAEGPDFDDLKPLLDGPAVAVVVLCDNGEVHVREFIGGTEMGKFLRALADQLESWVDPRKGEPE